LDIFDLSELISDHNPKADLQASDSDS